MALCFHFNKSLYISRSIIISYIFSDEYRVQIYIFSDDKQRNKHIFFDELWRGYYKLKIKTETFWQIVKILILFVKLSRQETLYFCLVKMTEIIDPL